MTEQTNFSKEANELLNHLDRANVPYVIGDNDILMIDLKCLENFKIHFPKEVAIPDWIARDEQGQKP
jgi:hypothetical protein